MLLKFIGQKYPTLLCLAPILKDFNNKLAVKPDEPSALKAAKSAMLRDFDDRYQDADVQLLMNKAALDLKIFISAIVNFYNVNSQGQSQPPRNLIVLMYKSQVLLIVTSHL